MDGAVETGAAAAISSAAANGSRDPGRARLAAASRELLAATTALDRAQALSTRLSDVTGEVSRLEAELAALRAADEARLGAWIAEGRTTPRPSPSLATLDTASRLAVLAEDAAAARAAMPAAEREFQHRAEVVRALQQQRDEAICAAASEAARTFAECYRSALSAAREREARLRGLRDELLTWGNRTGAPAASLAAAAEIAELIAAAKRRTATEVHSGADRRLIEALATDPDAGL